MGKNEMKKYRLRDVLLFYNGKSRPNSKGKYPLYGGNGIIDYVNEYNYENNIIIGRVGANCGSIQECSQRCWVSDNAISVTVRDEFDKQFIYHLLKLLELNQKHIGAAQPLITQEIIGNIETRIPPLPIQRKIAAVLTALDDKIALNRRINEKLEAMAKRLYDYWFVQFDFPDENGRPYKSSGGKMVWNETLKREIPVGGEVDSISRIADILPGGTPSKAVNEYWNGDIPFFGPTDYSNEVFQLTTAESITQKGLDNCSSLLYPNNTILITARGSVGKLVIVGKPMAMNQSCYAIKPKKLEDYSYLFYLTVQLIGILKLKETGSVFKSITTSDIEHSSLIIASQKIINLYCQKVSPIFEQIKYNSVEISRLTALRDRLLPLLMNGQVEVG